MALTAAPWDSAEWHEQVQVWIRRALGEQGLAVAGPVSVVKQWPLSCVLHVPVSDTARGDTAAYFKSSADLPLFVNEATVTRGLAELVPEHIPIPLAVDEDLDWLLVPDVGAPVGWEADLATKAAYLSTMARIQIRLVERVDTLFDLGCIDRRMPRVVEHVRELLVAPETDAVLSTENARRLRELETRITGDIASLEGGPVGYSLLHGDLHGGNVAFDEHLGLARIIDWTDAAVAHPFFEPLDVFHAEDSAIAARLTDAYLDPWREVLPAREVDATWELARHIAAVHHAMSYLTISRGVSSGGENVDFPGAYRGWLGRLIAGYS